MVRRLAHEPFGWRPTVLEVSLRRYRCTGCGHVWRQDTSRAAEPRATLSRRGLWWALEALVCQHLRVARVADALGVSWNTADDAVLAEAPSTVELRFNESVGLGEGAIRLLTTDADPTPLSATATDATVTVELPPLPTDATYAVAYRVVSADGHPVSGVVTARRGRRRRRR